MLTVVRLFATTNPPNGRVVLTIGLVMLTVSVLEILGSKRRFASGFSRAVAWAGRLFAIAIWLLMIVAGLRLPWR